MFWDTLRGHQEQVAMFRRAVARGRTSHAYLLVGPAGIGKRRFALGAAQCLFCQRHSEVEFEACGHCPACKQVVAGMHPDLLTVGLPEGKRELPIDLILGSAEQRGREGLCHDLSLRPMSATRRVAIIDDADCMNDASANALLKTLEEPPPGAILFLLTPDLEPILPTIRSRCQPIRFDPLPTADVAALIEQLGWETDPVKVATAAALSGGSLAQAEQVLEPAIQSQRELLGRAFSLREFQGQALARQILEQIDEQGGDAAAQRQRASWVVKLAVEQLRAQLAAVDEQSADRVTRQIERCLEAEEHLDFSMPVPLCLEGLFGDLARLHRAGVA